MASPQQQQQQDSEKDEAPFHVLMASQRPLQELLVKNDALQKDYLARRFTTLNGDEKPQETIWSAAMPFERAMMECCHLSSNNSNNESTIIGGSLVRGKEQEFVRLVALHCHTAASRALALAILERTIQQDKLEEPEYEYVDADDAVMIVEHQDGGVEDTVESNTNAVAVKSEEETTNKDESKPTLLKQEEKEQDASVKSDAGGRMSRFLRAGGLGTLKKWLVDAMTPVKTVVMKPAPPSAPSSTTTPKQQQKEKASTTIRTAQTTASPTGPLLLPLLQILTDMPFDKQLVMEVKIHKQIRRLKKQLDEVLEERRTIRQDSLQWTDPVAGGLVVNDVKAALATLMKTWEEQHKTTTNTTTSQEQNPFASLQAKMKHACDLLKDYEVGNVTEKPQFLQDYEKQQRLEKERLQMSKLTTEQRAARERQHEREQMLAMAQLKQSEAKAKTELLLKKKSRQDLLKRKASGDAIAGVVHNNNNEQRTGRKIKWKDGFETSDKVRRRNLLEQVHVYTKEPDIDEYDEAVKQEEPEAGVKQEEEENDGVPFANDTNDGPVKQEPE